MLNLFCINSLWIILLQSDKNDKQQLDLMLTKNKHINLR